MRHKTITSRTHHVLTRAYHFAQDSGIVTLPIIIGAALVEVLL